MQNEITKELFKHLVELAEFDLAPDEAEYLRKELNRQLTAIKTLETIILDDETRPISHGIPYPAEQRAGIRPDEIIPCEDVDAILAQAPIVSERYLIVPEIPHEELDE